MTAMDRAIGTNGASELGTAGFDVEWDGEYLWQLPIDLGMMAGKAEVDDYGIIAISQGLDEFCYLTHASPRLSARPDQSIPIPPGEVSLSTAVNSTGLGIALWIIEFKDDVQQSKRSWRLEDGKRDVAWEPTAGCDSVRIALRVTGSGYLRSARISVATADREKARTDAPPTTFEAECIATWDALNRPKSLIGSGVESVPSPLLNTARGLGAAPRVTALPRDSEDPAGARDLLKSLGLDETAIVLDTTVADTTVFPHLEHAVRAKEYEWTCPFSGSSIRSSDTFLVSEPTGRPYTFVRFESGNRVFYLVLCPFRGSRIGAYFPDIDVVVSRLNLGRLVCVFRGLAVRNAAAVRRYLHNVRPKQLVVPLNTMSHLGHVLLNEFEAVQWLFDAKLESQVDVWLKGEVGFVDIEDTFPEISRTKLRYLATSESRFRYCVEENLVVVRPQIAFFHLSEAVARRFTDFCRQAGERLGQTAEIEAKLAPHFPVLWCEIRANDRMWINQIEGVVHTIAELKKRYPRPAVVIAGWSRMQVLRDEDERMIAAEQTEIQRLANALGETPHFVVSGRSLAEKMLWAFASDVHLSIFGTGMLLPVLAQLPGVVLVSEYYQRDEIFMGDGHRQAHFMDGDESVVVLPLAHMKDDLSEKNPERRGFLAEAGALSALLLDQVPGKERPN